MSLFGGLFTLILTLAVVLFAISNLHTVDVFYFPGETPLQFPLYLVALGLMGLGFFLGACSVWLNYAYIRRDRRKKARAVKNLEKEIKTLSEATTQDEMPSSDFFPTIPDIKTANKK